MGVQKGDDLPNWCDLAIYKTKSDKRCSLCRRHRSPTIRGATSSVGRGGEVRREKQKEAYRGKRGFPAKQSNGIVFVFPSLRPATSSASQRPASPTLYNPSICRKRARAEKREAPGCGAGPRSVWPTCSGHEVAE